MAKQDGGEDDAFSSPCFLVNTIIMNSALTRPYSIEGLYKTYFSFANRFKFTDLLRNYIQNEEWKDKSQ